MKILVVEDERRIAQTLKKGLEIERYVVDVAYRGDDGYDLAVSQEYDLIILDLMLPGLDGTTVCQNLRKKAIHTPILMLTAKSSTADTVQGLDAGADDYLSKPFAFEELLARMRSLIRRPQSAPSEELVVETLRLNLRTFAVSRNDISVSLTQKEFALLAYLMRNKNTTVSKSQIISHVWDYDADILPNTVEVYMKHLRRKIDDPFPKNRHLIQTVRGFGYQLKESHV